MIYSEFSPLCIPSGNEAYRSAESIERSKIVILTQFLRNNIIRNSIIINIQGQITNRPHKNARLAGENEFWRAANHIASALLLIGSSDPEAFLKLDMIY